MSKTSNQKKRMSCTAQTRAVPEILSRIADKWSALAICALSGQPLRYCEIERRLGGISQKMLTQTLRSLERDGLIERKVFPQIPPRVEYRLTRLGKSLHVPLSQLCRWAAQHSSSFAMTRPPRGKTDSKNC